MNNFSFDKLDPEFCKTLENMIEYFKDVHLAGTYVPYSGLRTLDEQARLWRQSRGREEIFKKVSDLRDKDAHFLADIIERVGPQPTRPWATNAIPGYSYHNWGQAVDFYFMDKDKKIQWKDPSYYRPLGHLCERFSLRWGGGFSDWGHVQFMQKEIPELYSLSYVNDYFRDKN